MISKGHIKSFQSDMLENQFMNPVKDIEMNLTLSRQNFALVLLKIRTILQMIKVTRTQWEIFFNDQENWLQKGRQPTQFFHMISSAIIKGFK